MKKDIFEKDILNFTKKALKFIYKDSTFVFDVTLNSSKLFSEVEIEIWDDDDLIYFYSIIIYIDGKKQGKKESLLSEFLYDLFSSIIDK